MGPSVCSGDGTSEGWMKGMLDGSKPKIPRSYISFVDVRDTAVAHLKAVQVDAAANKRFILSGHDVWVKDVAAILSGKYPKCKVPTELAEGEDPDPGNDCDNTRSREVLGIQYTPLAETMCHMADSLIANGKVTPSQ